MANLPPHFKENDVDQLLAKFGQVVSTRILRDTYGQSKGVGFARMESREKCEQIIQVSLCILHTSFIAKTQLICLEILQ